MSTTTWWLAAEAAPEAFELASTSEVVDGFEYLKQSKTQRWMATKRHRTTHWA